jgi:hypothetical protein
MDKNIFNGLVDSLLEPKIKESIQQQRRHYSHASTGVKETSLRLAPRGELKPCGDCGDLVNNHTREYELKNWTHSDRYWRKHCVHCGKKWNLKPEKKSLNK